MDLKIYEALDGGDTWAEVRESSSHSPVYWWEPDNTEVPAMNDSDGSPGPRRHEYPNYPEVSGTALPLLATVLAGFAVTIIIQLTLRRSSFPGLDVPAEGVGSPILVSCITAE